MLRTVPLAVIAVMALALSTHSATPTFQSQDATQAVAEYLRAVEEARRTCLTKLDSAEKEALKSGSRDDAAQIQAARSAIDLHRAVDVFHPFAVLEQQVAGTRWANSDNARYWSQFDEDHTLRNSKGEAGKWAIVADNTIASTTGVKYVYLWVISEDGETCQLQRFRHEGSYERSYTKQ